MGACSGVVGFRKDMWDIGREESKIKDVVNEAEKEGKVNEVLFMWVVPERVNWVASSRK